MTASLATGSQLAHVSCAHAVLVRGGEARLPPESQDVAGSGLPARFGTWLLSLILWAFFSLLPTHS